MTSTDDRPVVVGYDGSECARQALHWAADYASVVGAPLAIVTAWEWPQSYGAPVAYDGYDPRADAERLVGAARATVHLPTERISVDVREGSARRILCAAAEQAQLLVVGSKGHSTLSGLVLGSVSAYCVQHADAPVV